MNLLENAIIFLVAAVVVVPVFKKLGLGSVLGYLTAGMLIGPWGLGLVTGVEDILHIAEFGVILLLFVIGLELHPARLWLLRKPMLVLGGGQFLITTGLIYVAAVAFGLPWRTALVLGMCLSLSSTAFAVQLLSERNELMTHYGRTAFSVLLFQDMIVIAILALLPLLSVTESATTLTEGLWEAGKGAAMIAGVIVGGHYLVRPLLRVVANARHPELFSAASLLVVLGTAALMHSVGLSMALGAFMAGVLLADSEFRHALEANIEPFKGLLLGLFFIAIGMSMNLGLLLEQPAVIGLLAAGLLAGKAAVLFALGRLARLTSASALSLAAVIAQGGEFAFVILHQARGLQIMTPERIEPVILAVTLSMAVTPLLIGAAERLGKRYLSAEPRPFDRIEDDQPRVVLIGFGRFGQIVGRILSIKRIRFTALESNVEQVDFVRRHGAKVYFGDATRLDTLRSAGLEHSDLIILSIVNQEVSVKVAATVKKYFPRVKIFARARNRHHAYRLMDVGVDYVIRETFLSAVEMSRNVLQGLNVPEAEAGRIATAFAEYDETLLKRQYAIHHDEEQISESIKQATRELQSLFEEDAGSQIDTDTRLEKAVEYASKDEHGNKDI